jgi:hypothetical protein
MSKTFMGDWKNHGMKVGVAAVTNTGCCMCSPILVAIFQTLGKIFRALLVPFSNMVLTVPFP